MDLKMLDLKTERGIKRLSITILRKGVTQHTVHFDVDGLPKNSTNDIVIDGAREEAVAFIDKVSRQLMGQSLSELGSKELRFGFEDRFRQEVKKADRELQQLAIEEDSG